MASLKKVITQWHTKQKSDFMNFYLKQMLSDWAAGNCMTNNKNLGAHTFRGISPTLQGRVKSHLKLGSNLNTVVLCCWRSLSTNKITIGFWSKNCNSLPRYSFLPWTCLCPPQAWFLLSMVLIEHLQGL